MKVGYASESVCVLTNVPLDTRNLADGPLGTLENLNERTVLNVRPESEIFESGQKG